MRRRPPRSTLFPYTTPSDLEQVDLESEQLRPLRVRGHDLARDDLLDAHDRDRKSTRLNSSHLGISYAVFCLKKKNKPTNEADDTDHHDARVHLVARARHHAL